MQPKPYDYPGTLDEYLPDPREPIDGWLQAQNSSNVKTTLRIVADLCGAEPAYIVDPYAGAGSAAVVARLLRVPFFGIELDPVLTCVTLAKTHGEPRHVRTADHAHRFDELISGCLDLLCDLGSGADSRLSPQALLRDLEGAGPSDELSRVVQGDASLPQYWSHIAPPPGHGVIYTSPPFDVTSPRLSVTVDSRDRAARLLSSHGLLGVPDLPAEVRSYGDYVIALLRHARLLGPATVIIEHEPPDDGSDERQPIARRIVAETDATVCDILETKSFSKRGMLSLLFCELP